jgi:hypothetical protein
MGIAGSIITKYRVAKKKCQKDYHVEDKLA